MANCDMNAPDALGPPLTLPFALLTLQHCALFPILLGSSFPFCLIYYLADTFKLFQGNTKHDNSSLEVEKFPLLLAPIFMAAQSCRKVLYAPRFSLAHPMLVAQILCKLSWKPMR